MMLIRGFFLLSVVVVNAADSAQAEAAKPNIVFIMADDLGFTDLGCYGSRYYETPNIDRLATEGIRLTNHHHCQNCQPTRAAIMSGQYSPRTGTYTVGSIHRFDWSRRPLRPVDNVVDLVLDRELIPQQLKEAGYATGIFGKWHLGNEGAHFPGKRGFDEAIISSGKHVDFVTQPKIKHLQEEYLADFLTDRSIDFIRRHKDEPFFLYLPHFGVHSPFQAKKELIKKFQDKSPAGGHRDPIYAAMISSVDESVGRIVRTLDELDLAKNTVVIFTSDNGGVGGYVREGIERKEPITDNAPLRSGKGSLYEGGTRVPLIVRWAGRIEPGSSCDVPTVHVDFYPTFLSLAAAPNPSQTLDGVSLLPVLQDGNAKLPRDAIYQHFPGYLGAKLGWRTTPVSVIQSGNWKLMEFLEDGHLELYNLAEDIGETHNLADSKPEKARELADKLHSWRTSIQAPIPGKNDPANSEFQPPGKGQKKRRGKRVALN